MNHANIIDELGGIRPVAAALGCDPSRVSRWRRAGIPVSRWPAFVGLGVPFCDLHSGAQDTTPAPPLRRGPKPRQVVV